MRTGKDGWDKFSPTARAQATADMLRLLDNKQLKAQVFAAVVEKKLHKTADIIPHCFEALAANFDGWLAYQYQKHSRPERGIFILDRSKGQVEQTMQTLHHLFKHSGHAKGKLRNFAEVPLFLDSKASRLIQMADNIAYWIYRRYQALDDRGFQIIQPHFCKLGGTQIALHEVISDETRERLKNIKPPEYPFPAAPDTGMVAMRGQQEIQFVQVETSTISVTSVKADAL